jgi:hypothetical protein
MEALEPYIFYNGDPTQTILHTEINIVRHLFFYLKSENEPFRFTYGQEGLNCIVTYIGSNDVTLKVPGFKEKAPNIRTQIQFEVMNILYNFDVRILRTDDNDVTIQIPHEIHSIQRRRHRRINSPSLFMHFTILYSSLFTTKRQEQEIYAKYPYFMNEIISDTPSVKLLNYMLTDEALRIAENYEIVFYKDMEELAPLELKILGSKKNVYIGDTSKLGSYIEPLDSEEMLNYTEEYESFFNRLGEFEALEKFEKMKKDDSREFLVSYLYCPIIQFNDVIGHIKLYTTYFSKRFISFEDARWFSSLVELFGYGITKNYILTSRYFQGSKETAIINISLGGLLFELEDEILYDYLTHHRRMKMHIPVYEDILEIHGEIIRNYQKGKKFYMAVLFFKAKSEDMAKLENYLYDESQERIKSK